MKRHLWTLILLLMLCTLQASSENTHHWAFQPLSRRDLSNDPIPSPIDSLIQQKLHDKGIRPNPTTEPHDLVSYAETNEYERDGIKLIEARMALVNHSITFEDNLLKNEVLKDIISDAPLLQKTLNSLATTFRKGIASGLQASRSFVFPKEVAPENTDLDLVTRLVIREDKA